MFFDKLEKILLLISSVVYIAYIGFVGSMINLFREYAGNEYLRNKIVDQIREQTRLTQASCPITWKIKCISFVDTLALSCVRRVCSRI